MKGFLLIVMLFCLIGCFSGCSDEIEVEKRNGYVSNPSSADETESSSKYKEFRITDCDGNTVMTQEQLKSVSEYFDGINGSYSVCLTFTDEGAANFADATSRNIGETLDIYVDDILIAQPTVNAAITGGEALVSVDSADEMASICKMIRETIE